ncbi:zf-HC2 domain-containing protein, partial [Streptomyces flavofungini]|uniref:zf-HC2 domain-containing protein n=1 Tax=Streptomyces flavofungini TaxID=68200 RepID=UPI0034DE34A9
AMSPLERHRDAGAYALGVLDAADAFRFEEHLAGCPLCHLTLDELHLTVERLRHHGRSPDTAGAAPRAADRVLGELGRLCRARRRRRLCAVAVAVVLAVGAPVAAALGVAGGRTGDDRAVAASLTARDRAWGTEIDLAVRDPAPRSRVCELVAVGKDGSERTVTTWRTRGRDAGRAAGRT